MSEITAPMAGKVIDILVKVGDSVKVDDEVLMLEAMKMEMPIVATDDGTIKEIKCNKGDAVGSGDVLIVVE